MTEKDIFEKYANLRKTKLNAKNNKEVYPKSDVMTTNIKRWKCEKEHEVKSKIGNIFVNEKILKEYAVKIYEIDPYFLSILEKIYKLMKIGVKIYYLELMFILLNISYL